MHPEIEAAIDGIGRLHGKQLAACESLRDFVLEIGRPWGGRALKQARTEDGLLGALLARSANTFWAVLELARIGLGEQAMMLNRSLFEDMVDAHWITVEPELATTRYAEHLEHGKMVMFDALGHHPKFFDPADIPGFDPARRKSLDGLFGTYGHKSWTGVSLHERIEAIEHLWTDPGQREHLHFFWRIVQRMNNQQLHPSAEALNRTVRRTSETEVAFKMGPGDEFVEQALFGAFWTLRQILGLVLEHFDFEQEIKDRLETMFEESSAAFRSLSADELRAVGRNDPCPCGSGKKFKRCHGQ